MASGYSQKWKFNLRINYAIRSVQPETHQELRWHLEFELQITSPAVCSLPFLRQRDIALSYRHIQQTKLTVGFPFDLYCIQSVSQITPNDTSL